MEVRLDKVSFHHLRVIFRSVLRSLFSWGIPRLILERLLQEWQVLLSIVFPEVFSCGESLTNCLVTMSFGGSRFFILLSLKLINHQRLTIEDLFFHRGHSITNPKNAPKKGRNPSNSPSKNSMKSRLFIANRVSPVQETKTAKPPPQKRPGHRDVPQVCGWRSPNPHPPGRDGPNGQLEEGIGRINPVALFQSYKFLL